MRAAPDDDQTQNGRDEESAEKIDARTTAETIVRARKPLAQLGPIAGRSAFARRGQSSWFVTDVLATGKDAAVQLRAMVTRSVDNRPADQFVDQPDSSVSSAVRGG